MSIKNLQVGEYVVCNRRLDATVWMVVDVDKFNVSIVDALLEYAHPNIAPQVIDLDCLRRPTDAQLRKFRDVTK